MFTIGQRIGIGYLIMAILLGTIGGAGLLGADRISQVLDRIAGPIDATTRAVDSGIRGVLQQMIGVDRALDGNAEAAQELITLGDRLAKESFATISGVGLVPAAQLETFAAKMRAFNVTRSTLLQQHVDYRAHYAQLLKTIALTKDLLLVIEEQASQALVALEWDAGLAEDETTNTLDTEEWAVVGAAADARLALMTRLFDYRQLLDDPGNSDLREAANISLGDLQIYIESLAESDMLDGVTIGKGPFARDTFDVALLRLYTDNETRFNTALETHSALRASRDRYAQNAEALMHEAHAIEAESRRIVAEERQQADDSRTSVLWLVGLLIGAGLAVAFAAYVISLRTIASPLKRAARRMHEIATGDGDLTARLDATGRDEVADVSHSFNEFVEKIQTTVIEVREAVHQLGASAEQMDRLTDTGMNRANRQQSDTAQIATATHEMSLTVASVAESAQRASESADQAQQEAENGREVVSQTIGAIDDLGDQVDLATTTIQALVRESEGIGSVIDVIGSIAEQTNLLALNAAIEAARAGDQGRGFSVVADEVRTLANRTQQSTSEILAMVERLQGQARQAGSAMEQSRDMARDTVEKGRITGGSLEHIVESVTAIQTINQQIAGAAAEQRCAAEEISRSIERINTDGAELAADSAGLSESATSLAALSERLEVLVNHFRT
jgi:methyl-accepting chemotaxis protein